MVRIKLLFLALFIFLIPSVAFAESVTLTTYYPAPYGAYDRLKLVPRADPNAGGACDTGTLYHDEDDDKVLFCKDDGSGNETGDWGPMGGAWELDGDNVLISGNATNPNFKVGIGDITPDATLEVVSPGVGTDPLMVGTGDGDMLIVKDDGKVGVGETDPGNAGGGLVDPRMVIKGEGDTASTSALLVVNSSDTNITFVTTDDGKVGIGKAPDTGKVLDVESSVAITTSDGTAPMITFRLDGGISFTVGVDPTDSDALKITTGSTAISNTPAIKIDTNGDVTIQGKLTVKGGDDTNPDDPVMVEHVATSPSGYYATYAP